MKASCSSSSSSAVEDSVDMLERCFVAAPAVGSSLGPVMKDKYGAFGAVTLEKSKLDMSQKQSKSSPEVSHFYSPLFFIFFWVLLTIGTIVLLNHNGNNHIHEFLRF